MSTEIANVASEATARFELVQREAKALASSGLVPKSYENNTANCLLAINVARRLQCDPLTVMQNLDVIHGRPSWRAQFLVASFNGSGRYASIKYRFDGEKDDYGCTAYTTELATGEKIEGPKVTWKMVKAEGWLDKSGSKWKTMPDLMFRYRAAAFLVRTTAPEISMGFHTREEVDDIIDVQPVKVQTVQQVAALIAQPQPLNRSQVQWDAEAFMAELKAAATEDQIADVEAKWLGSLNEGDPRRADVAGECAAAMGKLTT